MTPWAEQQPTPADLETNQAAASAWEKFQKTLALAQKILPDRQPKANRKTLSVHDPETRRGKHGEFYDGYRTDLLMDADSYGGEREANGDLIEEAARGVDRGGHGSPLIRLIEERLAICRRSIP